jgi:RNA polymerase sigma factor (sigma-70 family)
VLAPREGRGDLRSVTVTDPTARNRGSQAPPLAADLEALRGGLRIVALRALGEADAADEAVQETIARAVAALAEGRLEDPAKLPAYVAGIARHVCAHLIRDRKPTLSLEREPSSTLGGEPQLRTSIDPLDALISATETERLEVALRALSPDDRRLIQLCFHEGRTSAEVATALGEPADTIRKRKSRALERLRHAFLGEGGNGDD